MKKSGSNKIQRTVAAGVLLLTLHGGSGGAAPAEQTLNRRVRVASGTLADSLKLAWKFKTGGAVVSSPAIVAGRVYIGSEDKNIYAVRLKDGVKLWSFATKGSVEASPLVTNGLVILGSSDRSLYALDAVTGKLRWKYATDDKILGGANAFTAPNGKDTWLVVGSYDNLVHCVNAETGKRVWTYETENYVNGTPAVSNGKVLFGGCDGILHVVNAADGKRIRTIPVGEYIAGSASVDGNLAYVGHYGNEVICADVMQGTILWRYSDRRFPYFATPAVTADRVIIGGRDKRLHCLNRRDGKPLWEFRTRGKLDSSPLVCDGKVLVGSEDGRFYAVGLKDGKERWSYQIGSPVMGSPTIADGTVLIGADDGSLYAFRGK